MDFPPPPTKFLCSLLDSQVSWIFRTGVLQGLFYWKPFTFNSLCPFCSSCSDSRRWDRQHFQTPSTKQQLLALWHWNVGAHLAHRRLQGSRAQPCDTDTGHSYKARAASPQTAFPGMSPLHGWLHKVQGAQQFLSQKLLNCYSINPVLIVAMISSPAS